ncbi:MAG: VWA domain-containing protein [Candidatus Eremiobacteraeota bacterium]|nr:VWA domain-containing protein [Candidatus Eremiobacteraeota bacterium]
MRYERGRSTITSGEAFSSLWRNAVVFGRVLRRFGFACQAEHTAALIEALAVIGLNSREDARAGAASLFVRHPEQRSRFKALFDAFWSAERARVRPSDVPAQPKSRAARPPTADHDNAAGDVGRGVAGSLPNELDRLGSSQAPAAHSRIDRPNGSTTYSFAEGLYRKDVSQLSAAELRDVADIIRRQSWSLGRRRTRRMRPGRRAGSLDARRSLRGSLRSGGEIITLHTRVRRIRQRDVVLLCDISGSMDRYSRLLLQFVYTVRHSGGNAEAFVFATRLTRITRQLRSADPDAALREIAHSVADWAGGTRIGESLAAFNRQWGSRVLARGAVVILISDGWDRGDIRVLGREMARLQRTCYRLVWLNPLLGSARYRPQTSGMQAALPFVDDFLPAHNLHSLVQLAQALQDVDARRPSRRQLPFSGLATG